MKHFFLFKKAYGLILTNRKSTLIYCQHLFCQPRSISSLTMGKPEEDQHPNTNNTHNNKLPSKCTVEVIGSGAAKSKSVFITLDITRYLFNCGEGTQRIASEQGLKFPRFTNLFITYPSWCNVGGILGFLLTLKNAGTKSVNIYGPPGIEDLLLAINSFTLLKKLDVNVVSHVNNMKVDDGLLNIEFVPIHQDSSNFLPRNVSDSNLTHLSEDINNSQNKQNENEELVESSLPHSSVTQKGKGKRSHSEFRKKTMSGKYSLCYICKTNEFGKYLDVENCMRLRVPPGPLFGQLKRQQDVHLSDGRIIKWQDCLVGDGTPEFIIIADCPNEGFLDALINEPAFVHYQKKEPASIVVHFTSAEIMKEPKYREWMACFAPSTKHLRINSDNECLGLLGLHLLQIRLNILNRTIFPLLNYDSIPVIKDEFTHQVIKGSKLFYSFDKDRELEVEEVMTNNRKLFACARFSGRRVTQSSNKICENYKVPDSERDISVICGRSSLGIQLYPSIECDFFHSMFINPQTIYSEVSSLIDLSKEKQELEDFIIQLKKDNKFEELREYPKILFLGTGSSIPSRYRNTSAILIYTDQNNLILLDCGEGTYGQMLRFFGKEKIDEVLMKLRMVYVTHLHADHHSGLITIIRERQKILERSYGAKNCSDKTLPNSTEKILLLIPKTVSSWLHLYHKNISPILNHVDVETNFIPENLFQKVEHYRQRLNLRQIKTVNVTHCSGACGISLTTNNGCKITYSGDTMPCTNLIHLGKNSDILIHEATFEDDLESMAVVKKHSTVSQAIRIGQEMNAKFILLTHFSQRYSHVPKLPVDLPGNVAVAFDNMMVSEKDLFILPKLWEPISKIFAEKVDYLALQSLKRKTRELEESHNKRIKTIV